MLHPGRRAIGDSRRIPTVTLWTIILLAVYSEPGVQPRSGSPILTSKSSCRLRPIRMGVPRDSGLARLARFPQPPRYVDRPLLARGARTGASARGPTGRLAGAGRARARCLGGGGSWRHMAPSRGAGMADRGSAAPPTCPLHPRGAITGRV